MQLQLDVFYTNVIDTFKVWFEDAEPTPKTELITDVIFKSGAYGSKKSTSSFRCRKTVEIGQCKKSPYSKDFNIDFYTL